MGKREKKNKGEENTARPTKSRKKTESADPNCGSLCCKGVYPVEVCPRRQNSTVTMDMDEEDEEMTQSGLGEDVDAPEEIDIVKTLRTRKIKVAQSSDKMSRTRLRKQKVKKGKMDSKDYPQDLWHVYLWSIFISLVFVLVWFYLFPFGNPVVVLKSETGVDGEDNQDAETATQD